MNDHSCQQFPKFEENYVCNNNRFVYLHLYFFYVFIKQWSMNNINEILIAAMLPIDLRTIWGPYKKYRLIPRTLQSIVSGYNDAIYICSYWNIKL